MLRLAASNQQQQPLAGSSSAGAELRSRLTACAEPFAAPLAQALPAADPSVLPMSHAVSLRSSGSSGSVQRCSGGQGCGRPMLQPRAAAGAAAGAGGEAQPPAPEPVQQAPKTKARPLSMIQRWRAFKFAVKEWAERMRCG